MLHLRRGHVRRLPVPDLLPAGSRCGYSPVKTGLALPADDRRADGRGASLATNSLLPQVRPAADRAGRHGARRGVGMAWLTALGPSTAPTPPTSCRPLLADRPRHRPGDLRPGDERRHRRRARRATRASPPRWSTPSQQVGGSIGTALLNTLAATAAATYLTHHVPGTASMAQAQLHSYATAYWWSAGLFAAGTVVSVLIFRGGASEPSATGDVPAAVHM